MSLCTKKTRSFGIPTQKTCRVALQERMATSVKFSFTINEKKNMLNQTQFFQCVGLIWDTKTHSFSPQKKNSGKLKVNSL